MSVQFSELHVLRGKLSWSPNGQYLATTERNQLMVRHGGSLQIMAVHTNNDIIDKIEWSQDSRLILCMCRKRGIVQIWSANDPKWEATIDEGLAGLSNAMWSPCNKHIITICEFQIRLTIWSLIDGSAKYIKYPKNNSKCIKFSNNGSYLAVVERVNHKDIIGIYSVEYWQLIHRFTIDYVNDCEDIIWSHNNQYIVVFNNCLEYKFVIYTPRGRKIMQYSAYDNALGIKCVSWSFNDTFLAVGSYDDIVRVFNTLTWRIVAQFKCYQKLNSNLNYQLKSTIIYQETIDDNDNYNDNNNNNNENTCSDSENMNINKKNNCLNPTNNKKHNRDHTQSENKENYLKSNQNYSSSIGSNFSQKRKQEFFDQNKTCYVLKEMPYEIECKNTRNAADTSSFNINFGKTRNKSNNNCINIGPSDKVGNGLKLNQFEIGFGISECQWSCDNRFIGVKSDRMENALFVWDMKYLVFHSVLINLNTIKQFSWNNINNKIEFAISCNNDNLYLWSKRGCVVIRTIASRFSVRRVSWKPNSYSLINKGSKRSYDNNNNSTNNTNNNKNENETDLDDVGAENGCIALIDRDHFCCCYDLVFEN